MTTDEFEYFESRFGAIDQHFVAIEVRFDAIDRRFEEVDRKFEEIDQRFDKVYNILDSHTKKLDDIHLEQTAHSAMLDRHERWHHQTAGKIGLKLKH